MAFNMAAPAAADRAHDAFAVGAATPSKNGKRVSGRAASNDNRASDERLDQYYTRQDVAGDLLGVFEEEFDPASFQIVEPSAGTGAFFRLLPNGSMAFDIDPKFPGIATADFLNLELKSDRPIATIGNPPFGRNASMAIRFFNHSARWSSVIAFVLPRTFRKPSVVNRLDPAFHLVREEPVPADAFLFRSKPYDVPAVFQIWVRREAARAPRPVETSHPDFEFTSPGAADFAIQRVGARAGRVHRDFAASPSSHYFVRSMRPGVESVMALLDFATVARDVAGNPSLAKAEIVALYRASTERRAAA